MLSVKIILLDVEKARIMEHSGAFFVCCSVHLCYIMHHAGIKMHLIMTIVEMFLGANECCNSGLQRGQFNQRTDEWACPLRSESDCY